MSHVEFRREFDERNRRDNRRQINSGNRQSACRHDRAAGIIAFRGSPSRFASSASPLFAPGDDDVRFSSRTDPRGLRVPVRRGDVRLGRRVRALVRADRRHRGFAPRTRSRRPSAWNSPSSATRSRRPSPPSIPTRSPSRSTRLRQDEHRRVLGAKTRSSRTDEPVHEHER